MTRDCLVSKNAHKFHRSTFCNANSGIEYFVATVRARDEKRIPCYGDVVVKSPPRKNLGFQKNRRLSAS